MVVPAKAPQIIEIPKADGVGSYVMQRKVGEETKKYAAPEHYPRKSKYFGHPEEFQNKFDKWMDKGRIIRKKFFGKDIFIYKEGK